MSTKFNILTNNINSHYTWFYWLKLRKQFIILTTYPSALLTMIYNVEAFNFIRSAYISGTLCPYRLGGRRIKKERMKIQSWEAHSVRAWREESG